MAYPAEQHLPWKTGIVVVALASALGVATLTAEHVLPIGLVVLAGYAALGLIVGLAAFGYPKFGLCVALFYIYASLSHYTGVGLGYPIVVLVVLGAALGIIKGDAVRLPKAFFNWSVAVFTVISVQSIMLAYDVGDSLYALSIFVKSIVVVYLIVHFVRKSRDLELISLTVFLGAVASVVLGAVNFMLGEVNVGNVMWEIGIMRFSGTYADPNLSAVYWISVIPLGVYFLKQYPSLALRSLTALSILLLVVATFFTFSRAAVFPLGFVVLLTILKEARSKRSYTVVFFVVAGVLLTTPTYYWYRLISIQDLLGGLSGDYSIALRLRAVAAAWNLFVAHPLTGVGLNNFVVRSGGDFFARIVTHNAYLDILVGVGLIGFSGYAAMHAAAIREFVRAHRRKWTAHLEWMNTLCFYAYAAYLSTLVGAMFLSIPFHYVIWVPLALGLSAGRLAEEDSARQNLHET